MKYHIMVIQFIISVKIASRDTDSYEVFAEFFDPVIEEYHRGFKPTDKHITDMNVDHLKGNINEPEKIISTRIRVARNITGFNLAPGLPVSY